MDKVISDYIHSNDLAGYKNPKACCRLAYYDYKKYILNNNLVNR
jgi:hypothetical protein